MTSSRWFFAVVVCLAAFIFPFKTVAGPSTWIYGNGNSATSGSNPVFAGTCTLNGASPAKCSVVIFPFPITPPVCVCSSVGTTAQIAGKGCAVSVVGAVVTITAQNNDNHTENILCF